MSYADHVYKIIKNEGRNWDALYQDFILEMVGVCGMEALLESKLIETCGVVNGRQLFVLCEKENESK